MAAVVERPIEPRAARGGRSPGDVLDGAREAVAHQLLVTQPDGTYAFRHALVGEAIYEDLLPGERTALHAALARAMEATRAARRRRGRAAPSSPATGTARTTCRGRSARRSRRARARSASTRPARRCATSRARSRCGIACPTPPSAPGMPRAEVLRAAAAVADDGFEAGRAVALQREAIAEAPPAPTRSRWPACTPSSAHYLRHATEHDASDDEVRRALELLPADARARARAAARPELEEPDAARPLPRGRARGARDRGGGAAARRARPRGGRRSTPRASRAARSATSRRARGCCARARDLAAETARRPSRRARRSTCPRCSTWPAAPRRRWPRSQATLPVICARTPSARSTTRSSSSRARASCCGWAARRRPRRRCPTACPATRSPRRGVPATPRCARDLALLRGEDDAARDALDELRRQCTASRAPAVGRGAGDR